VYDQVATVAWKQLDRELALKFAGSREFGRVSIESFNSLARKAQANPESTARIVRETLAILRKTWTEAALQASIPSDHVQALREHWQMVPILRESGELS
jgi:hypothetical protein